MSRRNRRSRTRWLGKLDLARHGSAGQKVGARNEERVLALLQDGTLPDWVKGARPATSEEDANGMDLVILTDKGEIGLQVKSGITGYTEFRRREDRTHIAVVMVKPSFPDAQVRKEIIAELEEIRGSR